MKIKPDYVLRTVAGSHIVFPIGYAVVSFNGMLTLNDTGVMLWRKLEQGAEIMDLVQALTAEYDVSEAEALEDVKAFLDSLRPSGCLDE